MEAKVIIKKYVYNPLFASNVGKFKDNNKIYVFVRILFVVCIMLSFTLFQKNDMFAFVLSCFLFIMSVIIYAHLIKTTNFDDSVNRVK